MREEEEERRGVQEEDEEKGRDHQLTPRSLRDSITANCQPLSGVGQREPFWVLVNIFCFPVVLTGIASSIQDYVFDKFKVEFVMLVFLCGPVMFLEMVIVFVIHDCYRGMPYRSIGCLGKATVDVITVCSALMIRQFFPYDFEYLIHLVGLTVYLHTLGQIMHAMLDLNIKDVLLGVLMEVLVYMTGSYVCSAVLICCGGVICYRYLFYSAPITPDVVKKGELETLPC